MSSQTPVIAVSGLSKHYKVASREAGLKAATKSLFKRVFNTVKAVDEITFNIEAGEVVGFLGPNGAGKTTTLKMLSGLLYPTAGSARVLGFEPSRRQADFLQQVALVMGNRSQLSWDLPAVDSFELQRAIYGLPSPPVRADPRRFHRFARDQGPGQKTGPQPFAGRAHESGDRGSAAAPAQGAISG